LLESSAAFKQQRTAAIARNLAFGALTCLGRHTVTGIITAAGQQFIDWTSAYRLFAQKRINTAKLFNVAMEGVLKETKPGQEIIGHMDDTILRKTGKKVTGTAWRRDPLGPPFHTNFIWGQRFLQISMALPDDSYCSQSRAIPVDFHHCPSVKRPGKDAEKLEWDLYKQEIKQTNLSTQGSQRINLLRRQLDQSGAQERNLLLSVDGSYTNNTILKSLPQGVTLIGRTRKDTKLYLLPETSSGVGRKRVYGDRLPTPQEIRQSDRYAWENIQAWAAGKKHMFSLKVVRHVRWRAAGEKYDLQLVIIRPLAYRLTKKSPLLYRQPAYLICTDPDLNIQKLLQAYLWRWEIEVNFRDEKTLLGCGEAQVRKENTVEQIPAFIVAMYAFLHLAGFRATVKGNKQSLPRPVWYPNKNPKRQTSGDLINLLRTQLWAKALGCNFSSFVKQQFNIKSQKNKADALSSALLYLRK